MVGVPPYHSPPPRLVGRSCVYLLQVANGVAGAGAGAEAGAETGMGGVPGSRAVPASLSPRLQRKRARHKRVVDSSDDDEASSADDFQ